MQAAVLTTERGEELARDPGALAYQRGHVLQLHALIDPDLPWPDGTAGLWRDAATAYAEAADLGHPHGAEMAAHARVAADADGR